MDLSGEILPNLVDLLLVDVPMPRSVSFDANLIKVEALEADAMEVLKNLYLESSCVLQGTSPSCTIPSPPRP